MENSSSPTVLLKAFLYKQGDAGRWSKLLIEFYQ
jgi:hypothetical protein